MAEKSFRDRHPNRQGAYDLRETRTVHYWDKAEDGKHTPTPSCLCGPDSEDVEVEVGKHGYVYWYHEFDPEAVEPLTVLAVGTITAMNLSADVLTVTRIDLSDQAVELPEPAKPFVLDVGTITAEKIEAETITYVETWTQ